VSFDVDQWWSGTVCDYDPVPGRHGTKTFFLKKIKQEHGKAFEKEASEVLHSCDYIKSERHNPAQTKAQQPES